MSTVPSPAPSRQNTPTAHDLPPSAQIALLNSATAALHPALAQMVALKRRAVISHDGNESQKLYNDLLDAAIALCQAANIALFSSPAEQNAAHAQAIAHVAHLTEVARVYLECAGA